MSNDYRTYSRKAKGWPVSYREPEVPCKSCGDPIYWVKIKTKKGEVKALALSALKQAEVDGQLYAPSHYSDCPESVRLWK